jgi:hypothetical protein
MTTRSPCTHRVSDGTQGVALSVVEADGDHASVYLRSEDVLSLRDHLNAILEEMKK